MIKCTTQVLSIWPGVAQTAAGGNQRDFYMETEHGLNAEVGRINKDFVTVLKWIFHSSTLCFNTFMQLQCLIDDC